MDLSLQSQAKSRRHYWVLDAGFTLLELLLVVAILSALALGTISLVDETDEQLRFDDSKTRLNNIREGIIGDLNGHIANPPSVSGFLADMGRLPNTVSELLNQGNLPVWSYDTTSGLWAGWRGPYIYSFVESNGLRLFHDGWGTLGDTNNFGWRFEPNQATGQVVAQTYGSNGIAGGVEPFELDYPASGVLVNPHESLVDITRWRVTVFAKNPNGGDGGGEGDGDDEEEEDDDDGGDDEGGDTVTICHHPGQPSEQTMIIPVSALEGHLGHGDELGSCSEGDEEEGDTGEDLPLQEMTVRLRLFYPESGSMNWPAQWLQTDEERDAAPYLSEALTIPVGAVIDGSLYQLDFDFGATSKRVPFGARSLAMVDNDTGALIGPSGQIPYEVLLRPQVTTSSVSFVWDLE